MRLLRQSSLLLFFAAFLSCSTDEEAQKPVAKFTHSSVNDYLVPTSISFKNESTGASEYSWDFGDGSPLSNNINPIHVYEDHGAYTVTLIAANGDQFDQVTEEIAVFILPTADFTFFSNNEFKEQSEISFENKSLNAETYSWKFGDGDTSTDSNPAHVYDISGPYSVELTATNAKGSDVRTAEVTIHPLATEEELQLNKLKGAWTLVSANDGADRTVDFTDPEMVLTVSGNYAEGGTYNYSLTGSRPDPSPWPASGTWKFGTNKSMQIIRDPGGVDEIDMSYSVTDTNLILEFTVPDGSTGWPGGRISSVAGDWTFSFNK